MKIAPLIYSRTGAEDYFGNFAVRPEKFTKADIDWAVKKIRSAMSGVAKVNRRYLVISKGNTYIAGITCTMGYFVNNSDLKDEQAEAKNYALVNDNSREYAVFLGYVFKSNTRDIPVVTDWDLWQMFKKNLVPIWNKRNAKVVEVDYVEWENIKPALVGKIDSKVYCGTTLYDTSKISITTLFEEYLSRVSKENVTFCSGVDSISMLEKFTAASTSTEIIEILKHKQEAQEKENLQKEKKNIEKEQEQIEQKRLQEKQTQKKTPSLEQTHHRQTTILDQSKKSDTTKFLTVVIAIIVIVIATVTLYLINHSENPRKLQSLLKNSGKSANISSTFTMNTNTSSQTTKCLKNLERLVNISSMPAKEWSVF